MKDINVGFIGAGIEIGQHLRGLARSPRAFLAAFAKKLSPNIRLQVVEQVEKEIVAQNPRFHSWLDLERYEWSEFAEIAIAANRIAMGKRFCLTFGGDHSFSLASIGGLLRAAPNLGVVWVDAHGDINTTATTLTGRLHGMPLSFLLGVQDWPMSLKRFVGPALSSSRLVMIGVRDLDAGENELINDLNIRVYGIGEVRQRGMAAVAREAVEYLGPRPLHLSFDIDSLDPHALSLSGALAGVPVEEGLFRSDISEMMKPLRESGQLMSMDIAEINPLLAPSPGSLIDTYEFAAELINNAFVDPSLSKEAKYAEFSNGPFASGIGPGIRNFQVFAKDRLRSS